MTATSPPGPDRPQADSGVGPAGPAYRSPLLLLPGAVEADEPDGGVATHYGDPFAEQRRLAAGDALVDLSHRPVLQVHGPDRLAWMHTLTSQHLERLAPGSGTSALVLSPHGHVEHALYLVDDGETLWMHVEPHSAEALQRYLQSMVFWSKVEVRDVSADVAVVWRADRPGREAADGVDAALVRPTGTGRPDEVAGHDLFVPREMVPALGRSHPFAGLAAVEALRVAAGIPRFGFETDHRTIPHEVGWLRDAVALDKGCYRGQETVARVHNLGRPPRRLVLLHLDGSSGAIPDRGTPVSLDGREIGRLTTVARHYELGPLALAVVKRSVPADAVLRAGDVSAAQEILVPA